LIAGVLTVLVLLLNNKSDNQSEDIDSLRGRIDSLQRTNGDLTQEADTLRDEIDVLRSKLADPEQNRDAASEESPSGKSTSNGETASEGDAPPIYHQGTVTLAPGGDTVYFNAPPGDATWSQGDTIDRIKISGSGALSVENMGILPLQGEPATYATCSSSTAYIPSYNFDGNSVDVGEEVCVRGHVGRYGTIKMVDASEGAVTLEITTWTTP